MLHWFELDGDIIFKFVYNEIIRTCKIVHWRFMCICFCHEKTPNIAVHMHMVHLDVIKYQFKLFFHLSTIWPNDVVLSNGSKLHLRRFGQVLLLLNFVVKWSCLVIQMPIVSASSIRSIRLHRKMCGMHTHTHKHSKFSVSSWIPRNSLKSFDRPFEWGICFQTCVYLLEETNPKDSQHNDVNN